MRKNDKLGSIQVDATEGSAQVTMSTVAFAGLLIAFGLIVATGVWFVMIRDPDVNHGRKLEMDNPGFTDAMSQSDRLIMQFGRVRDYLEELESAFAHAGLLGIQERDFFQNRRELLSRMETRLVSFLSVEGEDLSRRTLENVLTDLESLQKKFISGEIHGDRNLQRS